MNTAIFNGSWSNLNKPSQTPVQDMYNKISPGMQQRHGRQWADSINDEQTRLQKGLGSPGIQNQPKPLTPITPPSTQYQADMGLGAQQPALTQAPASAMGTKPQPTEPTSLNYFDNKLDLPSAMQTGIGGFDFNSLWNEGVYHV